MIADSIKVEWDEDGLHMRIETTEDDSVLDFWVSEPEQLYDRVCAAVWPWLVEREEAHREFRQAVQSGTGPAAEYFERMKLAADVLADAREAYDPSDPKHPDWHSVHADIWDNREGK